MEKLNKNFMNFSKETKKNCDVIKKDLDFIKYDWENRIFEWKLQILLDKTSKKLSYGKILFSKIKLNFRISRVFFQFFN